MRESIQFCLNQVRELQARGEVEGAICILRDALKGLTAQVALSEQLWAGTGGVFDAAYAAKEEFDRLHADQATVQYALGELLRKIGRNNEASQAFQQVVQLQTDRAESQELTRKAGEALYELEHVVVPQRPPPPSAPWTRELQVLDIIERVQSDIQSILGSLAEDLTGEAKHELRLLLDWAKEVPLPDEVRLWMLTLIEESRHVLVMGGYLGIRDAEEKLRSIYFDLPKRCRSDAAS